MLFDEALQLLELPKGGVTLRQLKAAYRKKAMQTHPDKGGKKEDFIRVKAAYDYFIKLGPVPAKRKAASPMMGFTVHFGFRQTIWSVTNINSTTCT